MAERSDSAGRSPASRDFVSDQIGCLSIECAALERKAEAVASDASYHGTEQQVDGLLSAAVELRALAAEIEGLR